MSRRNNPIDATPAEMPAARFLRSAQLCRARDLNQLSILSDLVKGISELIHALQRERGASSIYLGSNGAQFADRLVECVAVSRGLEERVRDRLERVGEQLDPMSCSARFYTRVAFAFHALDSLPGVRDQVSTPALFAPQDSVKAFTDVIALLLAVGFEAADIAADPQTSRALIALVNFAQGKEYAGQERATVGAALSGGRIDAADRRHVQRLQAAQAAAFKIFAEFGDPPHVAAFLKMSDSAESAQYAQMRASALDDSSDCGPTNSGGGPANVTAGAWYQATTRRIDAMRAIEDCLAADLGGLCAAKLAVAKDGTKLVDPIELNAFRVTAPLAMLVADVDTPVDLLGMAGGVGLYAMGDGLPKPMRSILDVVDAQSRRIDDISSQLDSARVALIERKTIERAKGILMQSRRLSEKDAYVLLRQTAMSQNKRMFDIAQAVIGNADSFAT